MKKNLLVAFASLFLSSQAYAQTAIAPCVPNSHGGCAPVTATNPLPVTAVGSITLTTPLGVSSGGTGASSLGTGLSNAGSVLNTVQCLGRTVVGTTDTLLATDGGCFVDYSSSSSTAITIPSGSTTGFTAGWSVYVNNRGTGTATITPTSGTINGAASLVVSPGTGYYIYSDGTNQRVALVPSGLSVCAPHLIDGHTDASPTAVALTCGATIYNYGQAAANVNITLPATAANLVFVADVGTTQAANYWRFTSAAGGDMYLDGGVTGKDYVEFATPTFGNYLVCHTFKSGASAYSWTCRTGVGSVTTN